MPDDLFDGLNDHGFSYSDTYDLHIQAKATVFLGVKQRYNPRKRWRIPNGKKDA